MLGWVLLDLNWVLVPWWSKGMNDTMQEALSWKPQLLQAPWNCSSPPQAGAELWARPSLPGCGVVSAYASGWHDELLINGRKRQLLRKCLINPYWSKRASKFNTTLGKSSGLLVSQQLLTSSKAEGKPGKAMLSFWVKSSDTRGREMQILCFSPCSIAWNFSFFELWSICSYPLPLRESPRSTAGPWLWAGASTGAAEPCLHSQGLRGQQSQTVPIVHDGMGAAGKPARWSPTAASCVE